MAAGPGRSAFGSHPRRVSPVPAETPTRTTDETDAASSRSERLALAVERERRRRGRGWAFLLIGLAISVPFHVAIAIWLMNIFWMRPGPAAGEEVTFEFAVMNEPSLEERALAEVPEADAPAVDRSVDTLAAVALAAVEPRAAGDGAGTGSLEAGGSGLGGGDGSPGSGGGGLGPGGGGGGTSFFGIGGRGRRFAYIVDVSGSMAEGERFATAMNELKRSIGALPDYASVYVCLYHSIPVPLPFGDGWVRARPANVARIGDWLDMQGPTGGTEPRDAFAISFRLSPPPDVIFFLTDGEIPVGTAERVLELNGQARRTVTVHTVAFSSDAAQEELRRIARESDGTFRFVPVSGAGGMRRGIP